MEVDGEGVSPNAEETAGPSLRVVDAEVSQEFLQEDAAPVLQREAFSLKEDTPPLTENQNLTDEELVAALTAASTRPDEPPILTMELPKLMDITPVSQQKPPELIDETAPLTDESSKSALKSSELMVETTQLAWKPKLSEKACKVTCEASQVTVESQGTNDKSEEIVDASHAETSVASSIIDAVIDKDKPSQEADEASELMNVQTSESAGELDVEPQSTGEENDQPELVGEIPELPAEIPEVIDDAFEASQASENFELTVRAVKLIEAARELGGQNDIIGETILLPDEAMDDDTNQRFEHVDTEMENDLDEYRNISGQNSKDPFELTPSENGPEKSAAEQSEKDETNITIENKNKDNEGLDNSVEIAEDAAPIKQDTYYIMVQNVEFKQKCMICSNIKIAKFNVRHHGDKTYICNDACLFQFQNEHLDVNVHEYFTKFYRPVQIDASFKYLRQCKQCAVNLKSTSGICSWEALDFCKEHCLFRYQKRHSKSCAECRTDVAYNQMGKYAVRFGCIIRQFCSSTCLESRKKKIKICSYCQKSIHRTKTMIGNKYFCHDICKGMFEHLQKPKRPPFLINPDDARCFVCKSTNPMQIEFDYHRSSFYFCSPGCYTIFKFVQNCDTAPKKCHTCSKYALQQYLENHALYYDNMIHYFCSETCQHIYIITHRRVVPCVWCKVKKYNFDMIQKCNYLECNVFACSIFCLNQLKFNIESILNRKKSCYNCSQEVGIYDVQLANGTTQTFCSNHCISLYQTQFTNTSTSTTPARRNTRGRTRQIIPDKPGPLPIITNVCSLAPSASKNKGGEASIKKIIIVKAPDLPEQRNMCTQVDMIKSEKETQLTIEYATQEVQTEIPENEMKVEPILAPIYIPQPMHMWNAPIPTPYVFPVVIPCPVFIPLTKNTGAAVMKEVKKVQVKAPTDPFEAELLMMAELVAAEKKDDVPEVESEEEEAPAPPEETYSPEPVDSSNAFGEDMLQMALKMATDFEEPPVDLEGALTANTITPQQAANEAIEQQDIDDPEPVQAAPRPGRGRRRGRPPTRQTSRRGRRPANMEMPVLPPAESPQPMEPIEKPDANMCLKYTFGVNAWKQWVTTKNTELERSSRRLKLFKTELLQLTSDELNYSLCLFVNEVRKPNGSEYAPDTIYYLCLGIQQYLYENGRIDNIFCDSYYDKFTDCLDEICKKFSALYNDSHYIVTRVEEEHLWESKQLGAHSPHVLLSTLMFFNTKHFNLTNVDEHMQLSFSHIMKHWKRSPSQPCATKQQPGSRNVLLRFYPPQATLDENSRKKKVYEQQENEENPLRCPVKLYEFYLSKCPESVKTRNDVFYLLPERSCVPDSPVWYSTMALDRAALEKMLHRVKMVKEINVALLTN